MASVHVTGISVWVRAIVGLCTGALLDRNAGSVASADHARDLPFGALGCGAAAAKLLGVAAGRALGRLRAGVRDDFEVRVTATSSQKEQRQEQRRRFHALIEPQSPRRRQPEPAFTVLHRRASRDVPSQLDWAMGGKDLDLWLFSSQLKDAGHVVAARAVVDRALALNQAVRACTSPLRARSCDARC